MTDPDRVPVDLDLDFSLVLEAEPPLGVISDDLEALSAFVLKEEGARGGWEITVGLVDEARLQVLHRDFMGVDTPTDVMTFPVDDVVTTIKGGDLVISVDQARIEAGAWGHSPADEIQFLVVHGLLHLLGWRDDARDQRDAMLRRQQDLVDRWRSE